MKDMLINKTIDNIQKYYQYDESKIEEIKYGLESIYLSIAKIIVIFVISIFIHSFKELCLLFLTYGILRITGFGLHAKNSIQCWVGSILIFSIIPLLISRMNVDNMLLIYLSIVLLPLIIIYAPADTEKRPLINKKKRTIYKVITSIVSFLYILIMYFYNNVYISKLLFFSLLLETILILPISYRLLGLKYNNYRRYMKGGKK